MILGQSSFALPCLVLPCILKHGKISLKHSIHDLKMKDVSICHSHMLTMYDNGIYWWSLHSKMVLVILVFFSDSLSVNTDWRFVYFSLQLLSVILP